MPSNVKLAKKSFAAFKRGDLEAYVASFAPDVEWRMSAFVTGRGDYDGHQGVREFLAELDRLSRNQGEEFQDDEIVRLEGYTSHQEAREAAGLA